MSRDKREDVEYNCPYCEDYWKTKILRTDGEYEYIRVYCPLCNPPDRDRNGREW